MAITIQIEKMTREEKLQTMEAIWEDLSRTKAEIESPPWHAGALHETEARVAASQERVADWETAKRELRRQLD